MDRKNLFQTFVCNQNVIDVKVGESGFILINPNPQTEEQYNCSFVCETHFIISIYLIFFNTKEQAEKYRNIRELDHLLVVALKRVGPGLTGKDFEYDVSVDDEAHLASFQIVKGFNAKPFLDNVSFICFDNPKFESIPLTMDEYLSFLEKDSEELISELKTKLRKRRYLKEWNLIELNEELEVSDENEDYEYSARLRDEIARRN